MTSTESTVRSTKEERFLLSLAHPDDEAFGHAGVLAILDDRGVPVTLVLATRGEAGQISDPALATPDILGPVREWEVRRAMATVGVDDVRFLGYRDSGMDGTPENDDPRALIQTPMAELTAHLVGHIRSTRPTTVITFGPDGIYGHPDHVCIHHATVAAVAQAAEKRLPTTLGDPWRVDSLYYAAAPRERLLEWHDTPNTPFHDLSREQVAQMGTPTAEITHWFDVRPYADRKRSVISNHRTQVGPNGPMADMPPEMVEGFLTVEHLRRVPLPWDSDGLPRDLLDEMASAHPKAL